MEQGVGRARLPPLQSSVAGRVVPDDLVRIHTGGERPSQSRAARADTRNLEGCAHRAGDDE
jgi:hypothetical protein